MFTWLTANGPTIVIALILLVLVYFAARKVLKNKGGCNCGHCGGGCGHCALGNKKEKDKPV
ncbi:FeoB-associated Cys-rich membrane protein [Clostridium sp. Marseille-P2415]|uniref:FeoB-associated Cys-rich membrane protein n=1 Tax=Clostridium sp. Marseille-P2415 TaxID=1805471 RepID=UPI0009884EEB|nr:FeoB-associated Cys-rich membrane protein [Clostridium sp. Marseille-P2415]